MYAVCLMNPSDRRKQTVADARRLHQPLFINKAFRLMLLLKRRVDATTCQSLFTRHCGASQYLLCSQLVRIHHFSRSPSGRWCSAAPLSSPSDGYWPWCLAALLCGVDWRLALFLRLNEEAGRNVLTKAQAFTETDEVADEQLFGVSQLPRLNLIREAGLPFGNYHRRTPLVADLGLYQGDEIGPYVEGILLQLLGKRFLPAQMQGLLADLEQAPAGSGETRHPASHADAG